MTNRRLSLSAVIPLLMVAGLVGCSPKATEESADTAYYTGGGTVETELVTTDAAAKVGEAHTAAQDVPISAAPQLAYDYNYGFRGAGAGMEALVRADQAACEQAGPTQCQMIALSSSSSPDDSYVSKSLELRVSPDWLKAWRGRLAGALKANKARIGNESVTSEDLSLSLVDTEAHIANREALRDRLQQIIRSHPGKVSELVEAEAQLAQVQQDIDSARSQLAVMKKRVATVHLTLNYQSDSVAASNSVFAPVVDALKGSVRAFMTVIGVLITLFAVLLPLALIAVPAFILGRKWWLNRKTTAPK